jgi:hypothetical protein
MGYERYGLRGVCNYTTVPGRQAPKTSLSYRCVRGLITLGTARITANSKKKYTLLSILFDRDKLSGQLEG